MWVGLINQQVQEECSTCHVKFSTLKVIPSFVALFLENTSALQ